MRFHDDGAVVAGAGLADGAQSGVRDGAVHIVRFDADENELRAEFARPLADDVVFLGDLRVFDIKVGLGARRRDAVRSQPREKIVHLVWRGDADFDVLHADLCEMLERDVLMGPIRRRATREDVLHES